MAPAIAFFDHLRPALLAVEERLRAEVTSDVEAVYELGHHVRVAGGKRIRPALALLTHEALGAGHPQRAIAVGAALELVHMATLVHDDVVDGSSTRRGQATANAMFGNGIAVIAGDFLLARALRLLAADDDINVVRIVAAVTVQMSEGAVVEIIVTGMPSLSMDTYLQIITGKTAALFEACCQCGALVAGASADHCTASAMFGRQVGMAFQISDDLLDYTGDPQVTGKAVGTDLRDGRPTLPFLLASQAADERDRGFLLQAISSGGVQDEDVSRAVDIMTRHRSFEQARGIAQGYLEDAERWLHMLPPSRAREHLRAVAHYMIDRDR